MAKLKPKKLIKDVTSLFAMSGKKGKRMKSLFVIGAGSNMYPTYGISKRRSRRKRRTVY
jgi:hypothetical protein